MRRERVNILATPDLQGVKSNTLIGFSGRARSWRIKK